MLSPTEQRAVFALLLHAALADGSKSESERSALKRITEGFATDSFNPWMLYQDVLGGRVTVEAAAAELMRPETRLLAYEMAVGVCDTDGPPNPAERTFLNHLRASLQLPPETGTETERNAESLVTALPVATGLAASNPGSAPAPASAPAPGPVVDTAALEKSILNHAILTGALELLPQSLATMAVVPIQMKMVYGIGKAHGYSLDRGHIRDFIATAGAGLAAQAVEGYARKLLGGLVGGVLGKGLMGGLARHAVGTGSGAALTFAATYAIGHLALRYYAGGRRMETAVLKETYRRLLDDGGRLFSQHGARVEQQAKTLTPTDVMNFVRQA